MRLLHAIGVAGWAWKTSAGMSGRLPLWAPFFLLAATQGILLVGLLHAHAPWLQSAALPLYRSVGGEGAVHYPTFYTVLPILFARGDLLIGVLVGALCGGVGTLLFARALRPEAGAPTWRFALARYPALVLYYALTAALIFGIFSLQGLLPAEMLLGNRAARWGARLGALGLAIVVQTLLVYGSAWIVLGRRGFPGALAGSLRTSAGTFWTALVLVAVPALITYPFGYLQGRGDLLTAKFSPELMVAVLATWIVLQVPLGFLLTGSVTSVFLRREEVST